jgi:hypothetical protein
MTMASRGIKAVAAMAAVLVGGYAWYVYDFSQRSVVDKLVCIEHDPAPMSWTCDVLLSRHNFTQTEVAELKQVGGATFPLSLTDRAKAEAYLEMFIANGVDVNAVVDTPSGSDITPLHMVISEPDNIRLLLKHGAKPDIRDANGETALDRAKRAAAKGDAAAAETVKLLSAQAPG